MNTCLLQPVADRKQRFNSCRIDTYHCTLLQRTNLALVSSTVTLRVSLRSSHIHNRIFEGLLVIRPCRPLSLQRLLEIVELVCPLLEVLLHRMEFLLERLVLELGES